jgi:hypothetical protein
MKLKAGLWIVFGLTLFALALIAPVVIAAAREETYADQLAALLIVGASIAVYGVLSWLWAHLFAPPPEPAPPPQRRPRRRTAMDDLFLRAMAAIVVGDRRVLHSELVMIRAMAARYRGLEDLHEGDVRETVDSVRAVGVHSLLRDLESRNAAGEISQADREAVLHGGVWAILSDLEVSPDQLDILHRIARAMGVSEADFERVVGGIEDARTRLEATIEAFARDAVKPPSPDVEPA